MNEKALGRRIKAARKDCGITSERLAELTYLDATYMRQIESGAKVPSLPVFVTLCNALHVSPMFLLADMLEENEMSRIPGLLRLWDSATPNEIRMVTAILQSALQVLEGDTQDNI